MASSSPSTNHARAVARGKRLEYFTIVWNRLEALMRLLARAKRQAAASLGSGAMRADARQSEFCMYLSGIVLGGLLLNVLLGWWWADPLAGLVMVPIVGKEGIDALRGKACCAGDGCH